MGIIRILPSEVAGRIAAGEVIERPASVVKELVENSIDAGATRIRVIIENGGHKLIQVVDNGCGMDRQDAMMCLQAHATSKISTESDVGQIHTLGFRGEALPSIASVSRFELQTRTPDADAGTEVQVYNGAIADVRDCGCAPGTSIRVGYIFGNLPARRKFLKGAAAEDDRIEETMMLLALSRPGIGFELTLNGKTALRVPASADIPARVQMLLGKDDFASMIPVDYEEDDVRIYGFISKPGFTRNTRREQRVIVNGRAATADTVYFAVRDAYGTLMPSGRYPSAVLYIDVPPDRVDVNVHPAKREVRFRDSRRVSEIIAAGLRQGLQGTILDGEAILNRSAGNFPPSRTSTDSASWAPSPVSFPPPASSGVAAAEEENPFGVPPAKSDRALGHASTALPPAEFFAAPVAPAFKPMQESLPFAAEESLEGAEPLHDSSSSDVAATGSPVAEPSGKRGALQLRLIGSLEKGYLLAESTTGLIVVNVRAAAQRVFFERLLANLEGRKICQQPLLMPVTVNLAPDEARLMSREVQHFQSLGYCIEPFGGGTFIVTAVPASLGDCDIGAMLRDIIADLRRDTVTNRQSSIHLAQTAARHSVRGGCHFSPQEEASLLRELNLCAMPYTDPAGLPTMVHITWAELSKRFQS